MASHWEYFAPKEWSALLVLLLVQAKTSFHTSTVQTGHDFYQKTLIPISVISKLPKATS